LLHRLKELREELGHDGVVVELNPGGVIPPELDRCSCEIIARGVVPALR